MTLTLCHELPSYALTPERHRRFANDRSGPVVGAYAAARLIDEPSKPVRFDFEAFVNGRWETCRAPMYFGMVEGCLRTNSNPDLDGAGSHMVASDAMLGVRIGTMQTVNAMVLACTIQNRVDHACRPTDEQKNVVAFLFTE